ncbi:sex comb on midleg-like protein 1 [Erethizon dorsatum]
MTQTSTCDGDGEKNTILYDFPQDTTHDDTLIYNAVQRLEKKFDIIDRKVSKIQRSRMRYTWYYRKPLGHSRKSQDSSASENVKAEEVEMSGHCSSLSHSENYSPTSPVRRPENSGEGNMMPSIPSEELPEVEQEPLEEQEPFGGSPTPSVCGVHTQHIHMRCDDMPGPQLLSPGSPRFPANSNSSAEISPITPVVPLTQSDPSLTHSFNMSNHFGGGGREPTRSSFQNPSGFTTSSPIKSHAAVPKQTLSDDPSEWSVEDVILFLNHTDPQISGPLIRLLRKHEIDGKALLLLNSKMVMKYMGLKLGTSLKLCHYIEKLKEEKSQVFSEI